MRLLAQFSLSIKVAIAGVAMLALVAALTSMVVRALSKEIEVADRERLGITAHRPLMHAVAAVQLHRGTAAAAKVLKKTENEKLNAIATEVAKRFAEAAAPLAALANDKLAADFKMIQSEWTGVLAKLDTLSETEVLEHHSIIVSYLLNLADEVANHSGLALDPNAESYWLVEAILNALPRMTEDTALARGAGMIAIGQGVAEGPTLTAIFNGAGGMASRERSIDRSLKRAFEAHDPTRYKLDKAQEKVANETRTFTTLIHTHILDKGGIQMERDFYWEQSTVAITAQVELYDAGTETLDELLKSQSDTARAKRTQVLGVTITAIFVVALLQFLFFGDTIRRLRAATRTAHRVATGDLAGEIDVFGRDEVAQLIAAFAAVKRRLSEFEQAQLAMAAAHEAGDTDYRIDTAALPGTYGTLAAKINELVDAQLTLQQQFIEVVNDYARGELTTRMPQLPGKKVQITDAAFGVKRALSAISADIDRLVAAASAGDFSARGAPDAYQAQFATMVRGLNTLMANCEAGLTDANRVFASLAQGDLSARIEADYHGMFGQMKDNANQSMQSLGELIGRIREASESVDTASAEIARGNSDLSSRTESQAASLQETTASIEELTGTVAQNASSARQASTLATNASQIATRGGETVLHVVQTMGSIATSAKRVQDIIAVIDGIAFQTNILALNAAVEAARAGEQGKGFAVVASEVRNLAQRSAAAAKEIKGLITDSSEQVDAGTALVNVAGSQMQEIVDAVKQVTDIIAEIAAASAEQHQGIEQVNRAVSQMDTATQQNAALVEEASAAAEAMRSQAQLLAQAVGEFSVGALDTAPFAAVNQPSVAHDRAA